MGSNMNFRNFGGASLPENGSGRPQGLARQPSVYSLTFDEFQNTWGAGLGKDFGSMNMDELLKNIWTAEETQAMTSSVTGLQGSTSGGNLQRQGSLTLPRTLSQKTVDEVWRDLMKETAGPKDGGRGGGSSMPQRQRTLGEMTLEEFLVKAGVVREDAQQTGRPNNNDFYTGLCRSNNNNDLALAFQHVNQNSGIIGNQFQGNSHPVSNQPTGLSINSSGARPPQQPLQQQPAQQQSLFPKPATLAFTSPMQMANNSQLASPGGRSAMAIGNPSLNNSLVQGGGMQGGRLGMVDLGAGGVTVATGSPSNHMSSEPAPGSHIDSSSLSPVPYAFNRGRKGNIALEKVVERRQRRMIKNRESAARSRARKQAYTLELEAEVAKLKELNKDLQRKQAEMQKDQMLEKMKLQWGGKRQCLRRTLTGPW